VGCFEDEDSLPVHIRRCLETHSHVILQGQLQDTALTMRLPMSWSCQATRGSTTVVLEAHAAGKPVVGALATGIVDMVVDGETGLLFPVGDVPALADALARLITTEPWPLNWDSPARNESSESSARADLEALYREYLGLWRYPCDRIPAKSGSLVARSNQ